MAAERKYSDGEMREILERALQNHGAGRDASDLSHAELLAIGEQVGVPPEAMARAAAEVTQAKLDAEATRSLKSRRQKWLAAHAAVFAVINGLLFTVNFLTTPGEWWVLFSVFFWGLALAAHAGIALVAGKAPSSATLERERRKLAAERPRLRVGLEPAASERTELEASSEQETKQDSSRVASRP